MRLGCGLIAAVFVVALVGTGLATERRVLPMGADAACSLALSPDGVLLAAGTNSGRVLVLRAQSGEALWQAEGHTDRVEALAWSPDGTLLASGAADSTVCLWDAESGRGIRVLATPKLRVLFRFWDYDAGDVRQEEDEVAGGVNGVAWNPSGTVLAAELLYPIGSEERAVVFYDVTSGEELRTVVGQRWVSFSPTGAAFATRDEWGLTLWDTLSGREIRTFVGGQRAAWNPAGTQLAVAGGDSVEVWDGEGQELLAALEGRGVVLWSPDGRFLITDSARGGVVWDAGTWEKVRSLGRGLGAQTVLSPDGQFLVRVYHGHALLDAPVGGGIEVVHVWTGSVAAHHGVPYPGPLPVALGPGFLVAYGLCTRRGELKGGWLAPCIETGIAFWDYSFASEAVRGVVASLQGQLGSPRWIGFTPDGGRLASTSSRSRIAVWDAGEGNLLLDLLSDHRQGILRAALSPDGSLLATTGVFWDKTVQVWDLATSARRATVSAPWDVKSVAWSPDGTRIAFGVADGSIRLAERGTWVEAGLLYEKGGVALDLAFDPSGRTLAAALGTGIVTVWDVEGQSTIAALRGHTGPVQWVAFSPDGRLLASASGEEVKLWATSTWEEMATLPRGAGGPLAFHPDRALLALATPEGKAEVWSLETFEPVAVTGLRGVVSVAFSPDGLFLATGHADGSVLVWSLSTLLGKGQGG